MSRVEGDTWATSGFEVRSAPQVFVQWKGTDACLDFTCTCGYSGHYDGMFAYGLKCFHCGAIYTMPHTFGLIPGGAAESAVQETDGSHDERRQVTDIQVGTFDAWEAQS